MANHAYYALHKLHILPHDFAAMTQKEQAFIIASIDIRIDAEKKEAEDLKSKTRGR